ncbi:hypothetical protein [Inediibacterium massiliense]|uniref:hypothetical protein n=1 Tax=Inediibacterium massiliense TaxID=1658111 RepID=UPI0006B4BE5E|nr:hypothetical protein [Inediibacterium massiliense]
MKKWFKRKEKERDKEVYKTHKMYDIEEFIFDDKIKKQVSEILKTYRDDFKPNLLKENSTTDTAMLLRTTPLIEELKYFYNNDLCIAVATSFAVLKSTNFNLRTHAYYAENAIFRISNIWEYLFIILNEFLYTDLIIGRELRNEIIEAKCHNIDFVKHGNGYKPVITRLPDDIIDEIKPTIKNENKLFNISLKGKKNSFLKAFKKMYTSNKNLQFILDLYDNKDVKKIIDLRNKIVHGRPLGAKFSVASVDIMPAQGVNIDPQGWYDLKGLHDKLEKNLSAIRTAIQRTIDIIFTNDLSNQKVNEGKFFFVYKVKCNNCSKKLMINDFAVDYFKEEKESIICPHCRGTNTTIGEKVEVHDRYYFSNVRDYREFILKYWETN